MRMIDADNLAPDICDAEIEYGTKPVHFSANAWHIHHGAVVTAHGTVSVDADFVLAVFAVRHCQHLLSVLLWHSKNYHHHPHTRTTNLSTCACNPYI